MVLRIQDRLQPTDWNLEWLISSVLAGDRRETGQKQVEPRLNCPPDWRIAARTLLGNVRSTVRYLKICFGSNVSEDRQYG